MLAQSANTAGTQLSPIRVALAIFLSLQAPKDAILNTHDIGQGETGAFRRQGSPNQSQPRRAKPDLSEPMQTSPQMAENTHGARSQQLNSIIMERDSSSAADTRSKPPKQSTGAKTKTDSTPGVGQLARHGPMTASDAARLRKGGTSEPNPKSYAQVQIMGAKATPRSQGSASEHSEHSAGSKRSSNSSQGTSRSRLRQKRFGQGPDAPQKASREHSSSHDAEAPAAGGRTPQQQPAPGQQGGSVQRPAIGVVTRDDSGTNSGAAHYEATPGGTTVTLDAERSVGLLKVGSGGALQGGAAGSRQASDASARLNQSSALSLVAGSSHDSAQGGRGQGQHAHDSPLYTGGLRSASSTSARGASAIGLASTTSGRTSGAGGFPASANAPVQAASEIDDAVEVALEDTVQGSPQDAKGSSGDRPDPSRLSDRQQKSREKLQRDTKQRAKAFQSGSSMLQRSMEPPNLLGSSHGDSPRGGSDSSSGSSGQKHGRQAGVPTAAARKLLEAGSGCSIAAARERSDLAGPAHGEPDGDRTEQGGESPQLMRIRTQTHGSGAISGREMAMPPSSLETNTPPDDVFESAMRTQVTVAHPGTTTLTAGESIGGKKEQWVTIPTRVSKQEHEWDNEEGVVTGRQWATSTRLPVGVQQMQPIRETTSSTQAQASSTQSAGMPGLRHWAKEQEDVPGMSRGGSPGAVREGGRLGRGPLTSDEPRGTSGVPSDPRPQWNLIDHAGDGATAASAAVRSHVHLPRDRIYSSPAGSVRECLAEDGVIVGGHRGIPGPARPSDSSSGPQAEQGLVDMGSPKRGMRRWGRNQHNQAVVSLSSTSSSNRTGSQSQGGRAAGSSGRSNSDSILIRKAMGDVSPKGRQALHCSGQDAFAPQSPSASGSPRESSGHEKSGAGSLHRSGQSGIGSGVSSVAMAMGRASSSGSGSGGSSGADSSRAFRTETQGREGSGGGPEGRYTMRRQSTLSAPNDSGGRYSFSTAARGRNAVRAHRGGGLGVMLPGDGLDADDTAARPRSIRSRLSGSTNESGGDLARPVRRRRQRGQGDPDDDADQQVRLDELDRTEPGGTGLVVVPNLAASLSSRYGSNTTAFSTEGGSASRMDSASLGILSPVNGPTSSRYRIRDAPPSDPSGAAVGRETGEAVHPRHAEQHNAPMGAGQTHGPGIACRQQDVPMQIAREEEEEHVASRGLDRTPLVPQLQLRGLGGGPGRRGARGSAHSLPIATDSGSRLDSEFETGTGNDSSMMDSGRGSQGRPLRRELERRSSGTDSRPRHMTRSSGQYSDSDLGRPYTTMDSHDVTFDESLRLQAQLGRALDAAEIDGNVGGVADRLIAHIAEDHGLHGRTDTWASDSTGAAGYVAPGSSYTEEQAMRDEAASHLRAAKRKKRGKKGRK